MKFASIFFIASAVYFRGLPQRTRVEVVHPRLAVAVTDGLWQVNKIIGYLQVFPRNSCFLSLSSSCFEIFPPFSRQDDKEVCVVV